jgi:hypothetical protein
MTMTINVLNKINQFPPPENYAGSKSCKLSSVRNQVSNEKIYNESLRD